MLMTETRPVGRLIPYVRNARAHSDNQIASGRSFQRAATDAAELPKAPISHF
jgi:hypothetical protein